MAPQCPRGGMTLVECLVVVIVLGILVVTLFPMGTICGRQRSTVGRCLSNVKQIELGFVMYASDNDSRFPMQAIAATNVPALDTYKHFQLISNYEPSPLVFICPASAKKAAYGRVIFGNTNLSYFVNVDAAFAQTNDVVIGDEFIDSDGAVRDGILFVNAKTSLQWTRDHQKDAKSFAGALGFSDGHASVVRNATLRKQFVNEQAHRLSLPVVR